MQNKTVRELVLSGLFTALGFVLPIIFHMIGAGRVFLPMHIPILLAGFFISVPYAAAVGIVTPLLSSVFTGMPPIFPMTPIMMFELGVYGAAASLFFRKMKLNIYISLAASMIAGRITAGIVVWIMGTLFAVKLPGALTFATGAIATGLPGILIQMLLIPAVVIVLQKQNLAGLKYEK